MRQAYSPEHVWLEALAHCMQGASAEDVRVDNWMIGTHGLAGILSQGKGTIDIKTLTSEVHTRLTQIGYQTKKAGLRKALGTALKEMKMPALGKKRRPSDYTSNPTPHTFWLNGDPTEGIEQNDFEEAARALHKRECILRFTRELLGEDLTQRRVVFLQHFAKLIESGTPFKVSINNHALIQKMIKVHPKLKIVDQQGLINRGLSVRAAAKENLIRTAPLHEDSSLEIPCPFQEIPVIASVRRPFLSN